MDNAFMLVDPVVWGGFVDEFYSPSNYTSEGFIHLSYRHQLDWAANKFYSNSKGVFALEIDIGQLEPFLREEEAAGKGLFPHLYCALPVKHVLKVHEGSRRIDGKWEFKSI